jgi:hypothetical protein
MKTSANTAPARKNWVGMQFAGPQATTVPSDRWNSTAKRESRSPNFALNMLFDAMGQKFLLATVDASDATVYAPASATSALPLLTSGARSTVDVPGEVFKFRGQFQ